MGIPKRVLDLAAQQGGYVTREQLLSEGMSPSAINRRISERVIKLVKPGIYQVIPSEDHVDLLRGAVLALPDAVVSHQSAAHVLRFPKLPDLEPTVTVPSHTTHRFPGVRVRRCRDLDHPDIVRVDGLPATNVPRTLFDLAGIVGFREFDAMGESLIIAGRLDLARFDDITRRLARRGKRGSRSAHVFLEIRAGGERRDHARVGLGTAGEIRGRHREPAASDGIVGDPGHACLPLGRDPVHGCGPRRDGPSREQAAQLLAAAEKAGRRPLGAGQSHWRAVVATLQREDQYEQWAARGHSMGLEEATEMTLAVTRPATPPRR